MDSLFSCRNCIHNSGQSLAVGRSFGFCIKHNSIIQESSDTTCKYLHRKDLPFFVVVEGLREHAGEFAEFPALASLQTRQSINIIPYSEKFSWEAHKFDSLTNVLAQYYKSKPRWVFIESLTGGVDGRRAIAHACLIRRYLEHCGTWKSSYRLVIALIQDLGERPIFRDTDIVASQSGAEDALWDLVFSRFALIQEYGWHAGIDDLRWFPDLLGDAIVQLDWLVLQPLLDDLKERLTQMIIEHAKKNNEYFSKASLNAESYA